MKRKRHNPNGTTPDLTDLGLLRAVVSLPSSLVTSIFGWTKTGKSTLALSCPDPVVMFSFDLGDERAINPILEKTSRDIYLDQITIPPKAKPEEWGRIFAEFKNTYDRVVVDPRVRYIIIDTTTSSWKLVRLDAFDGKLEKQLARSYGPANADFSELISLAKVNDKNLILVSEAREEWVGGKTTGKIIRNAPSVVGYACDLELQTRRSEAGIYSAKVCEAGRRPGLIGEKFGAGEGREHELTLPWLMAESVPLTSPAHWGDDDLEETWQEELAEVEEAPAPRRRKRKVTT